MPLKNRNFFNLFVSQINIENLNNLKFFFYFFIAYKFSTNHSNREMVGGDEGKRSLLLK